MSLRSSDDHVYGQPARERANDTPTRLVTVPERMAAMRCLACRHGWQDLDAATSQYPGACPRCGHHRTEPCYDVDGMPMPEGWTW